MIHDLGGDCVYHCNAEDWRQGGQLEAIVVQARDDAQIFVKFWGEVDSNFET